MANSSQPISPKSVDTNSDLTVIGGKNYWTNQAFTWFAYIFAAITILTLFWMTWIIFKQAQPAIAKFGFSFLSGIDWDTGNDSFGALPYIYGTLVTSVIALLFSFPIGVAVALITSENFLPPSIRTGFAFIVELIASIPSVIVGLWGINVFIPAILPIQQGLFKLFNWIPLFNTDPTGFNMLTAGIVLAIMILPTLAAISRDVLLVVPKELRSASMALGATRWETIFRVLLPTAFSGIISATMLGLGRALGETLAVTMVIGNSSQISASLLAPAYTIPSVLANEFAEAVSDLHRGALTYLALILFALTLLINIAANLLVQWFGVKTK
ncbi:ABC phosphate transport system permease protein [Calothrix sp. NIES-4071]|nr:ABC phosphate transport system permease protein [Calothrix sp. NIES-4071]BAZ63358.1 ABC phosphate transport system permease protein [Calothrix sp. NIES-4105]